MLEVVVRTGDRTRNGRRPKTSAFRITRRYTSFATVKTSGGSRIRSGDCEVMARPHAARREYVLSSPLSRELQSMYVAVPFNC